ncbi:Clp protease N-terminal domain-containing protein [Nocardia amamiensis]|uniref:Clp protease N-terminal domain-containing protein n=1 Tax=Nocardia amamiensis TaxID=404578 RepID=A0ABS0CW46_9NOCA|nr:Clp protease N-terminal domain-containing protein [Nocardia amamiensis]MBF6299023.1 Clp protease N-terminal domain-containing protein [Nocardia amamiensis]
MAKPIIRTPMYEQLLADAENLARDRGEGWVGVEHVLIAAFSDPDAISTVELRDRMGVDPAELIRRLGQIIAAPIPGPGEYRVRSLDGTAVIRPA